MSKIATSIEQSKRLLNAGLDPESADMCYANIEFNPNYSPDIRLSAIAYAESYDIYKRTRFNAEALVPAWSISRLIDMNGPFQCDVDGSDELMEYLVDALIFRMQHK